MFDFSKVHVIALIGIFQVISQEMLIRILRDIECGTFSLKVFFFLNNDSITEVQFLSPHYSWLLYIDIDHTGDSLILDMVAGVLEIKLKK